MPGTLTLAVGVTRPGGIQNDLSTHYWLSAPEVLVFGQSAVVTIAVSPVEVSLRIDDVLVAFDTHPDDGRRELDDVTVMTTNAAANVLLQDLRVQRATYDGGGGRQIRTPLHPVDFECNQALLLGSQLFIAVEQI